MIFSALKKRLQHKMNKRFWNPWLKYNVALDPFACQDLLEIISFISMLIYMLLHLNYYEEQYFREQKWYSDEPSCTQH